MQSPDSKKIAIIGLGYVGLPLAVGFAAKYDVIGFDINEKRVAALRDGRDDTNEMLAEELANASRLVYSSNVDEISDCNVFIVTVPTPVDGSKTPDLRPLQSASEMLGHIIKKSDTVIYESTVFPGATEEYCVPIIERISGLKMNEDFGAGYSPERINPGDREHRLADICKVTSGSNAATAEFVDGLYGSIITAGTYKAASIKVAEAAKVIENTQRDLNIALMNELAQIFSHLDIDTTSVLEAASTKWNFLNFKPGLVGGHCIGVDPYYLTFKAQQEDFYPQLVLAGRRVNESMPVYLASVIVKQMIARNISPNGAKALVLGLAFKENCPDIRNTKVIDLISELEQYGIETDIHDPRVDSDEVRHEFGRYMAEPATGQYDAIVLAVPHAEFLQAGSSALRAWGKSAHIFADIKAVFPIDQSDLRL